MEKKTNIIQEGKAKIITLPGEIKKSDDVFYNPNMRINRDISSLSIQAFTNIHNRQVRILDVMASTGVRGVRYALECNNIKEVIFNDLNPLAIDIIKKNVSLNKLTENIKVIISQEDAGCLMHQYRYEGDVVDVDPFGSPAYYLEAASRCVSNKGLLMVTFTDTAVLSGTYPRTALRRYSIWHNKNYFPKGEIALRVALKAIAEELSKFDKGMVPLISISHKHYVRIIVKIDKHKSAAENNIKNLKYLYYKSNQEKRFSDEISLKEHFIGRVWAGNIGDEKFIEETINYYNKQPEIYSKSTLKLLEILKEEYSIKDGYYYDLPQIGKSYKISVPSFEKIKQEVENKGYSIAKSHVKGNVIVTNIPHKELVETIKRIKKKTH